MTSLVISTDIPTSINTIERLHLWSGLALAVSNPTLAFLEERGRNEKAAQAIMIQRADNVYSMIVRACIPVSDTMFTDRTIKSWMFAQEMSNTPLSAGFKSN